MKHTDSIQFDVMQGEHFVCTLRMPYNPLFRVSIDDIVEYAYSKRPTLRYEKDVCIHIDEHV